VVVLSEIIQSIINEQNFGARIKDITINYSQSNTINVFADQNMLETVLRNLISNSIKYTHAGGKIEIQTYSKEDYLELSVSDTGVGMSKEVLDNLFIIGEQESLQGTLGEKGTGLGLILCKDFIEKHNGKIWVESQPDKGSSFYIAIPHNS